MFEQQLEAQKTFHVTIQIPSPPESKNFSLTYDDGLKISAVTDTFINNKLNFSGKFYSEYAVLKISYTNASVITSDEYFIGTQPVDIVFASDSDFNVSADFHHFKLKNAIEIHQSKNKKQRNEFAKEELTEMNRFYNENQDSIWTVDSLKSLFYKKLSDVNSRDIEFVKKNPSEYYSFWMFRTQIIPITFGYANSTVIDFKNLLNIYRTVFPYSFRESPEGKKIKGLLAGRIATQKNYPAPNFAIKDIIGNVIQLSDFKGKYVLLDFWATWCAPCMAQLPFIKKIRSDYPADKLVVIGISADVNYYRFDSVVKENNMNWIHCFGNADLPKEYGVDAIPAILLIDKNGILIFDGKKEDNNTLISLLKKM